MSNELQVTYSAIASKPVYAMIREADGDVWHVSGEAFESYGTSSRTAADYKIDMTNMSGKLYVGNWPTAMANGTYYVQYYIQANAADAGETKLPLR